MDSDCLDGETLLSSLIMATRRPHKRNWATNLVGSKLVIVGDALLTCVLTATSNVNGNISHIVEVKNEHRIIAFLGETTFININGVARLLNRVQRAFYDKGMTFSTAIPWPHQSVMVGEAI